MSCVPLLTRLTASACTAAAVPRLRRPIAVIAIAAGCDPRHTQGADCAGAPQMIEALAQFRPTLVAVEDLGAPQDEVLAVARRLARQAGARLACWRLEDGEEDDEPLCARLTAAARPGDRVVLLHRPGRTAAVRDQILATPGLKLVEASAWLRP